MNDPSRPASGVRVVVRRDVGSGSGSGSALARDRSADRRTRRHLAWILLPPIGLLLATLAVGVAQRLRDDRASTLISIGLLLVLIPAIGALVMARHRRVVRRVPGRLWHSGDAVYLGPFDDVEGFPESAVFAARHRTIGGMLAVRLVVTADGVEVVPIMPGHTGDRLSVAFSDLGEVHVNVGPRKVRAIGLVRPDGRRASFKARPNDDLLRTLGNLGARLAES